jgi:hypothetical protein
MTKWACLVAFCLLTSGAQAQAQTLAFPSPKSADPTQLARSVAELADKAIAAWHAPDRAVYFDTLFRLQMVAGRDAEALQSIAAWRGAAAGGDPIRTGSRNLQYQIVADARLRARRGHLPFDIAFRNAFRAIVRPLDDRTSALAMRLFNIASNGGLSLLVDQSALQQEVAVDLARQKTKNTISLADALSLLRAWQAADSYRAIAPLAQALVREDDARRYIVSENQRVTLPDGGIVCVQSMRPRNATRLPALLEFTIYADMPSTLSEDRRSASNGYVGITGFSRGKACSPGQPVPLEKDGADAAALIGWIAKQPWSDGRVGMIGGSYDGFTQWAALKHAPPALKAIMPAVTLAPGIDMPMEGSIHQTFSFYWPYYVASGHDLDGNAFEDSAHWRRIDHDWYLAGRPYRDLDVMAQRPNPIWNRWMDHPAYDSYWQAMIPYGDEFAKIAIPVLTTTGYYDGGEVGALYYFQQHTAHAPGAEHYLVIGPYNHLSGQRGTVDVRGDPQDSLWGYTFDPAAQLDMGVLRYQWFDHIFKGAPMPALLKDRVNYEVMGANRWGHAPSLAAMANQQMDFYLDPAKRDGVFTLAPHANRDQSFVEQKLDFADRSDADRNPVGGDIDDKALDTWNALEFVSAPLDSPREVSGLFGGALRFVTNKRDFDVAVQLYELTPQHHYFELSWYMTRASYARDRSHRQLLMPGKVETLNFQAGRLTSRQFQRGSRLVVLIALFRQPDAEINYGTGGDVAAESIKDAKVPLDIKWLAGSVIRLPVRD